MGLRVEVEMLAVLLLLTPLMSDGLVVPKCELMSLLMSTVPEDMVDREKLVADLVCHADLTSHFDTSRITQVPSQDRPRERKTRGVPINPRAPTTTKPPAKTITKATTKPPAKTTTTATTKPPARTTTGTIPNPPPKSSGGTTTTSLSPKMMSTLALMPHEPINRTEEVMNDSAMPPPPPPPPRTRRGTGRPWTMYGVFQLSDRIACTSPGKPSLNICNLSCDKLTDDDITDDINCVLAILNYKIDRKANPDVNDEANKQFRTMVDMLKNTCPKNDYTQYFADC